MLPQNKYFLPGLTILLFIVGGFFAYQQVTNNVVPASGEPRLPGVDSNFMSEDLEEIAVPVTNSNFDVTSTTSTTTELIAEEGIATSSHEVIVENLTIPWDIGFLPNGNLLISERGGTVIEFDQSTGENKKVTVPSVTHSGEGGLLGLVLHPNFEQNRYVYLYKTSNESGKSVNNVIRYAYRLGKLSEETVIVPNIPGALFHNGGRMAFGPDGLLYIATGDAQDPNLSQDRNSLAGKILRVTDEGKIPEGNPFDSEVYSYGHRNPQGLTWDADGALWSTEHGRSGALSGLDEINLIFAGANYGWPDSQGDTVFSGTLGPKAHSGADVTWAPASAAYINGSVFFGGLRGSRLYEARISGVDVVFLEEHFVKEFGRIRTVVVGPDNMLYITTSNRDGRGTVRDGDDKIIRIDPTLL